MRERKHSGSYRVNEGAPVFEQGGWCGTRCMVYMTVIGCLIIYLIGAIITGVVYRGERQKVNCTDVTHEFAYSTPLVVVGPCFMSAGGAVLFFLLLQWFMCRPALN